MASPMPQQLHRSLHTVINIISISIMFGIGDISTAQIRNAAVLT